MYNYCIRIKVYHCLMLCIALTFAISLLLVYLPLVNVSSCECPKTEYNKYVEAFNTKDSHHKLAVLVPYRNRFEELLQFVPHMNKFLNDQKIPHHIFVLNQVDSYRFNRASLINVGFIFVKHDYDYIAMHDVDLLPLNSNIRYDYPDKSPFHVAAPELHPKYHYPTFVGGILLVKREHFTLVNGMSNNYWGWGLEDDEFYVRLKDAELNISRPINIQTGTTDTFKHIHDKNHRKRDMTKCYNQREVTRKRDRKTGLNNINYQITDVKNLTIEDSPVTILNIELECNRVLTPWCDCSDTNTEKNTKISKGSSRIGKNNKSKQK